MVLAASLQVALQVALQVSLQEEIVVEAQELGGTDGRRWSFLLI